MPWTRCRRPTWTRWRRTSTPSRWRTRSCPSSTAGKPHRRTRRTVLTVRTRTKTLSAWFVEIKVRGNITDSSRAKVSIRSFLSPSSSSFSSSSSRRKFVELWRVSRNLPSRRITCVPSTNSFISVRHFGKYTQTLFLTHVRRDISVFSHFTKINYNRPPFRAWKNYRGAWQRLASSKLQSLILVKCQKNCIFLSTRIHVINYHAVSAVSTNFFKRSYPTQSQQFTTNENFLNLFCPLCKPTQRVRSFKLTTLALSAVTFSSNQTNRKYKINLKLQTYH